VPDGWAHGGGRAEPSNPPAQGLQDRHNKRKLPCVQTVTDTHVPDTRVPPDNASSRPERSHRSAFDSGAHVGPISLSALTRRERVSVPTFQTPQAAFWCQDHSTDYPILGISWSSVIKEVHQLKACAPPHMGKCSELSQGELPGCQALHFSAALGGLNQINYACKSMSTSVSTWDKSGQGRTARVSRLRAGARP